MSVPDPPTVRAARLRRRLDALAEREQDRVLPYLSPLSQVYVRAYLGPHITFARAMEAQRAARRVLTEAGVSPQVLRDLDLIVSSQRGYRRRLGWSEASVRGYPLPEDDRLGCACVETTACAEDDEATAPAAAEAEEATPSPGDGRSSRARPRSSR